MIYLSFDIKEFDMPKGYDYDIAFERQITISRKELTAILDLLKEHQMRATFFSTVVFAQQVLDLTNRLIGEGHELASHTYYHSDFENEHLKRSKEVLEQRFGVIVGGLRMPRMFEVSTKEVKKAGCRYNLSVNPTFLPDRYNKLHVPKRFFNENGLWQIPAAISWFRFPLFWLSLHSLPLWLYRFLLKGSAKGIGYAALYFHPWEFTDLHQREFDFPAYMMRNSGEKMIACSDSLLTFIKQQGWKTGLYKETITN